MKGKLKKQCIHPDNWVSPKHYAPIYFAAVNTAREHTSRFFP